VCSQLIQQRRRTEIEEAINWAEREGLQPIMVTLTFPHSAWDRVEDLLNQQSDALRRMRAGGPWRRLKERFGYEGLIRTLELTRGQNGWHPHTHELWFVAADADPEAMQAEITERWFRACQRAGLATDGQERDFRRYAVDVTRAEGGAAGYLSKTTWEMAGSSEKRAGGEAPFQILERAESDPEAEALFVEYVRATKGRALIFWSAGLKDRVGVRDRSDEEAAEESETPADTLALLTADHWRRVVKEGARATILDLAELGGYQAVADWFAYFNLPPPPLPHTPIPALE